MKEDLKILDRITDVVLAYRPPRKKKKAAHGKKKNKISTGGIPNAIRTK